MMSGLWECMARNNPQAPKSVFLPRHHVTEQKRGLTHDTGGHSQITDHDHRMLLHHRTFDVALSTI